MLILSDFISIKIIIKQEKSDYNYKHLAKIIENETEVNLAKVHYGIVQILCDLYIHLLLKLLTLFFGGIVILPAHVHVHSHTQVKPIGKY